MRIPQLGYCLLWGQDGPPQSAELGPIDLASTLGLVMIWENFKDP